MRRRRSLRARTTAASVLVLLAVLVVAGVAGVLLQRADLSAGVAALAEDQARSLASDVPDAAGPDLAGEESIVQVVSLADGRVQAGSADAPTPLVPAPPGTAPVHQQIADPVPDEPDRYEAVALRSSDGTSYVVVARSLESVDAATASTSVLLLAGGALVLLTTGGLTWLATGRALSPVEMMRRRAETIPAEDLTRRLPVPPSGDELARLAVTLNDLLARIEESTLAERQFVADASHELRSPVATIRVLLESDRLSPHPEGHEGLSAELMVEVERLTALVDDLLVLARGDAPRDVVRRPVDVSAVVTAELRRARPVPVNAAVDDGLVVNGDPDQLAVAVRNLLDNAERHAASAVSVTATRAAGRVIIAVVDDGPGIPSADRDRVFERFVRLDDSRSRDAGGAGLGLAITRQTVESHGGTVEVSDGSCFTISLPGA